MADVEDGAREDLPKLPEDGMRKWEVIISRALSSVTVESVTSNTYHFYRVLVEKITYFFIIEVPFPLF
jgi:hypothetical protein